MKVSNKITLIGAIGALALVGTGFAAWQFAKAQTEDVEKNVVVTGVTELEGTITVDTFFLTFDQAAPVWTSSSHADSTEEISDVITTVGVTYTGNASLTNAAANVDWTVTYVADAAITNYVTVTGGSLGEATNSGNVKTATYTLPTLAWTANKPENKTAYDAMKTAVASAKVTFTVTVSPK